MIQCLPQGHFKTGGPGTLQRTDRQGSIFIKLNPKPLNLFALFYNFEKTLVIVQIADLQAHKMLM